MKRPFFLSILCSCLVVDITFYIAGTLLIDEMKLSEGISFDRRTLQFSGFVDLGEYTPETQKTSRADHALVFMFQPFRGTWVQVLGCFLTRASVPGSVLHKLMLECVILLSNSGFHVDAVTTDGAQWNRAVWKLLNINAENVSAPHPCDERRRLWMISDFPHLIKCTRNAIMRLESFPVEYTRVCFLITKKNAKISIRVFCADTGRSRQKRPLEGAITV